MQLLSYAEMSKVSGGHGTEEKGLLSSMAHYSFFSALLGGTASAIYGLSTNHDIAILGSENRVTITGSFGGVFWCGLGLSWVVGVAIGAGVAAYNAKCNENN